jgi:hypothetical protein
MNYFFHMAMCSQWNVFFLYFTLSEHTYNIYICNSSRTASCCLHRFSLSIGHPLGCRAEIRTRACHTASRRATICATPHPMLLIIIDGRQNQPAKAAAELTEARQANQFTCSPTNCDEVIQSFIRYEAKFIKRF